jgi:hypothetical protein
MATGARIATLLLSALVAGAGNARGAAELEPAAPRTFSAMADAAVATIERAFYAPPGRWNACVPANCGTLVRDWGADTLTAALFLRWRIAGDRSVAPIMAALADSTPLYADCPRGACTMWSDVPLWDAVADAQTYLVTRKPLALTKAERAFAFVDRSDAFARGACPAIDFQKPSGGDTGLKTLESDSNYIKAALLLHEITGAAPYLAQARVKYDAVRRYFLDPTVALYSVYVFDDGATCSQLPKRFFASVNGNMIANGLALARATGEPRYRDDAIATARAVTRFLSDGAGIYADLQADNDIAGPLVEAMYDLATGRHGGFARRWLTDAATAAQPGPSGAYGRFFDGPPPNGSVSAWSASGGLTVAIAAGGIDPQGRVSGNDWSHAAFVADAIDRTPATITFTGRGVALIGTIGDVCCEAGHARIFIDGRETFDNTGIWQNKSPASHRLPDSILLSWRWRRPGPHTLRIEPGLRNPKEGGAFIRLVGYELDP